MNQLFIPQRIKVGYQEREGTVNNRLAYIIYFDSKGVLRKEKSFEGWRDKKIDPEEFDNVPTDGFVINKGIQRYNWTHFGSGRSMMRVYDPRGIEFEVTMENLTMVLMNTDCLKRGLVGKFVYAWMGSELVLLPAECEEYQKAISHTSLQSCKIGARDMVPGCSYKTKKGEDLIYLGKFDWYEWNLWGDKSSRTPKKRQVFYDESGKYRGAIKSEKGFVLAAGFDFLAQRNTDTPVSNFAEIIEGFGNNIHANKVVDFKLIPAEVSFETVSGIYGTNLKKQRYFRSNGKYITEGTLSVRNVYKPNSQTGRGDYVFEGYDFQDGYIIDPITQTIIQYVHPNHNFYSRKPAALQAKDVLNLNLCDLQVVFENGKKRKIQGFSELS